MTCNAAGMANLRGLRGSEWVGVGCVGRSGSEWVAWVGVG